MIQRGITFFSDQTLIRRGDQWVRIEKPADAIVETFGRFLLLRLRSDWSINGKTFAAGSLLAANLDDYLRGARDFSILFQPSESCLLYTSRCV